MFPSIQKQQFQITKTLISTRTYAAGRPQVQNSLSQRPLKKIAVGKARPAIYHKFNCMVELSDGSVVYRKSQYPKDEIRMITDQRNNPIWNRSRPDVSLLDAESKGKLNKFKNKFAAFEQSGMTEEEVQARKDEEEQERKTRLETGVSAKKDDTEADDLFDMLGSKYVEKKLGGNLAQKDKKKK